MQSKSLQLLLVLLEDLSEILALLLHQLLEQLAAMQSIEDLEEEEEELLPNDHIEESVSQLNLSNRSNQRHQSSL